MFASGSFLAEPCVDGVGEPSGVLGHGPFRPLRKADFEACVEVGIVGFVELGDIAVDDCEAYRVAADEFEKVFSDDGVAVELAYDYASPDFVVEIDEPVVVARVAFYGDGFSGELGDVGYQSRAAAADFRLHEHLSGDILGPAWEHAGTVFGRDRNLRGQQIDAPRVEQGYGVGHRRRYLELKHHPLVGGETADEVVVVAHLRVAVDEIASGTVECGNAECVGKRMGDGGFGGSLMWLLGLTGAARRGGKNQYSRRQRRHEAPQREVRDIQTFLLRI